MCDVKNSENSYLKEKQVFMICISINVKELLTTQIQDKYISASQKPGERGIKFILDCFVVKAEKCCDN